MPTFEVTAPDGRVFEVTAPEGATQEQVLAYAKNAFSESKPAQEQPAPESPKVPLVGAVDRTISNIPESAGRFAAGIYHAVTHPVETGKTVLDIGAGALQSALAPQSWQNSGNSFLYSPEAQKTFDAAKQFYAERYGSPDKLAETIQKDPVGFIADVSAVTGAAGGASNLLSNVAKASQLPRTAEALATAGGVASGVSSATNPINLAAKVAKPVLQGAGNLYGWSMGMATGSGKRAMDEAIKGSPEFVKAMRGEITDQQVFEMAREGVQNLKDTRSAEYAKELAGLQGSTQKISLAPIKARMDAILKRFNVTEKPDGTLDFSRSALSEGASDIQAIYDDVTNWGNRAGDNTPVMLDVLKRRIADRYSQSGQARAAVTSMSNAVKDEIVKAVPEYAKMTADYAKSSDTINTIERALSTGNKAAADTALRKIMVALREDKPMRRAMLDTLSEQGGQDIAAAAAGRVMNPAWSNRLGPIAHFYGTSALAAYMHNPILIGLLPLASPRLVGELSLMLGRISRNAKTMASELPVPGLYVSRVPQQEQTQ